MLEFSHFLNKHQSSTKLENLIIFGAGTLGKLTLIALNKKGFKVNFFCDSDIRKREKNIHGIKIVSPEELELLDKNSSVFI